MHKDSECCIWHQRVGSQHRSQQARAGRLCRAASAAARAGGSGLATSRSMRSILSAYSFSILCPFVTFFPSETMHAARMHTVIDAASWSQRTHILTLQAYYEDQQHLRYVGSFKRQFSEQEARSLRQRTRLKPGAMQVRSAYCSRDLLWMCVKKCMKWLRRVACRRSASAWCAWMTAAALPNQAPLSARSTPSHLHAAAARGGSMCQR